VDLEIPLAYAASRMVQCVPAFGFRVNVRFNNAAISRRSRWSTVNGLRSRCCWRLSADWRMTFARATLACGSARESRQAGQLHAFLFTKNQLRFGVTHRHAPGLRHINHYINYLWDTTLATQSSASAPFALFRLLLFQREYSVNQGFLITPEPSVPAAILRVSAPSNHFAGSLAKVALVG